MQLEAARKSVGGASAEELLEKTLSDLRNDIESAVQVLKALYDPDSATAQMNELDANLREHRLYELGSMQQQAAKLQENSNVQECIGELETILTTLSSLAIEVRPFAFDSIRPFPPVASPVELL